MTSDQESGRRVAHEKRRSALLPAIAGAVTFFVAIFTVGYVVESLVAAGETVEPVFQMQGMESVEYTEGSRLAGAIGLFSALAAASAVYVRLRFVDPVVVYADWIYQAVRLGVAAIAWYAGLFGVLWLLGQDGVLFAVGVIFGLIFAAVSLFVFGTMYRMHTPPFETGDSNGQ